VPMNSATKCRHESRIVLPPNDCWGRGARDR
jgi:hypothetical protein